MAELSAYRTVWIVVLFDLPTRTPADRKRYTKFRKALLADGFDMMQYSVYMRHCPSEENAAVHAARVKAVVPEMGEVRVVRFTDKQFERMDVFHGKLRKKPEKGAQQLELF